MKKNKFPYPLFFTWAFVSLTLFLFSCAGIKDPVFKEINEFKLAEGGNKGFTTVSFQLKYFNPNHSGLQLKNAEGDAWIDGTLLGHFTMDTIIKIKANSDFLIPLNLKVDMKNIMNNAVTFLLKPDPSFSIRVAGKAKIGRGGVFINYPIRYEGKQDVTTLFK